MLRKQIFLAYIILGILVSVVRVSSNPDEDHLDSEDNRVTSEDGGVAMTFNGIGTAAPCSIVGRDQEDELCFTSEALEGTSVASGLPEATGNDPVSDDDDVADGIVRSEGEEVEEATTVLLFREDGTDDSPCQPMTEAQLYSQLQNIGGFNSRYMGLTPDNFPDILEISKLKNDTYSPETFDPSRANGVLKQHIEQLMETYDWSKEEAIAQAQKLGLQDVKTPEELHISRRTTRDVGAVGEGTTTINYCLPRGSETEDGYIRLCTVCAATTELPENYFPRYINEAVCDPDGSGRACFPIEGTNEGHGTCKQRVFNLSMLKRTGNCVPTDADGEVFYLEEWEVYTQPIRVWCDCELNRQSFLTEFA